MSSFRNIDVKSSHIQELQHSIQLELANHEYSSPDDPVMAEYIVVMLANQKTADQITAEMKDLIGSEYDAAFTEWIWKTTQSCLDRHAASSTFAQPGSSASAAAPSSPTPTNGNAREFAARTTSNTRQRRSRSPQASAPNARSRDQRRSRSPSSTNARRGNEARRPRSRSPPVWGRGAPRPRDYSSYEAFLESTKVRKDEPFDGEAFWRQKAEERRRNPPPPVIRHGPRHIFQAAYGRALRNGSGPTAANAERELFPTSNEDDNQPPPSYSEQTGVSIFGRAGIPDPRAPAFVPSSAAPPEPETTQAGPGSAASTSIFSRIDPMVPNNPAPAPAPETTTPTAHSSNFPTAPTETSICRWNVGCTNPMCPYSHASPANAGPGGDPNALVLSQQNCRFGARCTNKDCTRSHVSPAVAKIQARSAAPVSFTPSASTSTSAILPASASAAAPAAAATLSMDTALPNQTGSRPCRFGAACTRADCFFSHPPSRTLTTSTSSNTPCRFGLGCTRPNCFFSHPPGQRASATTTATTTAGARGGTAERLHVFATAAAPDEEMEVIIPGSHSNNNGGVERDGSDTVRSSSASVIAAV
ncbi:related to NAB2 - nuclear polyadenylated RNA-binding protein required for nuclear mRNA export [Ustilago trichophora]|uniref:Related to NAB2 - nuclear polyadenylated RNA-binding protein required for nuclear mRNA export n=1 Tax=Ustilago trichophora TaxID=86804 RepID=A0A5C3EGS1_9BASI|nr:related to NAB2 - nuclear polyadenylated RNA-binding protein required for nuclear mRNA export [Ustilago trichophora]